MLKNVRKKAACAMAVVMLVTVLPIASGHEGTTAIAEAATKKAATKKAATISSIANVKKTVEVDEKVTMPATVTAVMSDKTKKKVAVKWNKTLNSDIDGTYTASGTVSGYSKKVKFTLKVNAPKMGTIKMPEVTDNTLKKPSNITLGIGKSRTGDDGPSTEVDDTLLSVFWTPTSSEADEYRIFIYDQYKRMVAAYGMVMNEEDYTKDQIESKLNLDKIKNLTITAITVTPVKSTEEGRMTGDSSKNGTGETAVFECSVKVIVNTEKTVTMNATENQYDASAYDLSFEKKIAPYTYFVLNSEYKYVNSDASGTSYRGNFSGKDGAVSIPYVRSEEAKNEYLATTSKLRLLVYTDAVVENGSKGAYTITIYPVEYKSGK